MDEEEVSNSCKFRGHSYRVTLSMLNTSSLKVEVEDRLTANQWNGTFDSQYIEDLTRKTGNFKHFPVFVNMLQSAIAQNSDSVLLDLLTYSDLEALRKNKTQTSKSANHASKSSTLSSKRYLILTYTVEFDRIHYPLPLTFAGTPDPLVLQETIHKLQEEILHLKKQKQIKHKNHQIENVHTNSPSPPNDHSPSNSLIADLSAVIQHSGQNNKFNKQVLALKAIIKNLEDELMREKTTHQRAIAKRNKAYQELLAEVEELRSTERTLRVRVRSLTNELSILKRQSVTTTRRANTSRERSADRFSFTSRDRSTSRERLPPIKRPASQDRSVSARSLSRERTSNTSRDRSANFTRNNSRTKPVNRSGSRDRPISAPTARTRDTPSSGFKSSYRASRTPSPGARRFDPTAYIKERERRKEEASLAKERKSRSFNAKQKSKPSSRSGSMERRNLSLRSRLSSGASHGYSSDDCSDSSFNALSINRRKGKTKSRPPNSSNVSPAVSRNVSRTSAKEDIISQTLHLYPRQMNKPTGDGPSQQLDFDDQTYGRSAEISEIDARLERLQKLMQNTLQCST